MRNPRFNKLLDEIKELHDKKNEDYSGDEDPLANLKDCTRMGLDPIMGVMTRIQDKVRRLESFMRKGRLVNESVRDSLVDLSVYSLLAIVIMDEQKDVVGDVPGEFEQSVYINSEASQIRVVGDPKGYWKNGIFYENGSACLMPNIDRDKIETEPGC